jgi:predicted N-acetyltransferase YhbS
MIRGRDLRRDEIVLVWTIDRGESIRGVYVLEGGALQRRPAQFEALGWPPGEAERYTPLLEACHDRGGWLYGLFDDERLIAVAALDPRPLGRGGELRQLEFLHVSRTYRSRGLGRRLFRLAQREAARRGARGLYISATPSENTIDFYLRLGCTPIAEPDPELFALEPEDIHLECGLADDLAH